jgi:hypothetical protein
MASLVAAGSAATVVQLADFAGKVLGSTFSFISALAGASSELETLREKIQRLERLTEHIRRLGCSYQNSNLGVTPKNGRTFDLLVKPLTDCSIGLLDRLARHPRYGPEEATSTDEQLPRGFKWRVAYVVHEDCLKRLFLRLDGHVAFIHGLLSCIYHHVCERL